MTSENEQLNNPLHGLKLDTLLNELVSYYGFEILAEYTNINCFKNRATIASSLKFLRKTEWAREKIERFYLYNYKNLPKADDTQYEIPPRQRIIPAHQKPREPKQLILGQAPSPKPKKVNDNRSFNNKEQVKKQTNYSKTHQKVTISNTDKPVDPWSNSPK
ncbi:MULTISPECIES: VF530 family DNA-binding protein [Thalassotalea]|uniref:VF530 family DNA-binding protein n=1 Tax=Thalassotalea castellviae TaxID=3075612 RepID=A0ABU3A512_9GAMM|nr:VF530 family DNA-binding protein [Thalassotalea sp. W431]MDT0604910.1 VF530 family DNA-binding protein [Thalassotalea sp. W431]